MQPSISQALQEVGLTVNETKVYLALLRLKTGTASQVTALAKVHRVNVYDALERLREKGLISSIMRSSKRVYEAANPEQLMQLVKQKEELLEEVMPGLKEEFSFKRTPQNVHFFVGVEGIMQAYAMILQQNDTIYAFGGSGLNRKFLAHRYALWTKERIRQGVHVKAIYFERSRKDRERLWKKGDLGEMRFMPDRFKTDAMVDVCGDLVVNLLPKEGLIMAIVIENATIAASYRQFFRFMWQAAKP